MKAEAIARGGLFHVTLVVIRGRGEAANGLMPRGREIIKLKRFISWKGGKSSNIAFYLLSPLCCCPVPCPPPLLDSPPPILYDDDASNVHGLRFIDGNWGRRCMWLVNY